LKEPPFSALSAAGAGAAPTSPLQVSERLSNGSLTALSRLSHGSLTAL
jgi:hypothetical protein